MARSCRLVRAGRGVEAQWRRDGDTLVLSPASEPALAIALAEIGGISGDGFTIALRHPGGDLSLERLGADGPTLLAELRRDWPVLRAAALRLAGGERPGEIFAGHVASPALSGPFRGFFVGERLVVAPEGGDCVAHFVADCAAVAFDEASYAIRSQGWDGVTAAYGKLGARTAAFSAEFAGARARLTEQAEAVLARHLPTLPAAGRASLASRWIPGRLLGFGELEGLAGGFTAAFTSSWLAGCPRAKSGAQLLADAEPAKRYLGYFLEGGAVDPYLWLLVGASSGWSLELLSHGDWATYLFRGGDELPHLVEGLVRLPDFSREALYLPVEDLVEDRARYAIPARDLPLLKELRSRLAGRKVHASSGS